jgi:hypothetical protein
MNKFILLFAFMFIIPTVHSAEQTTKKVCKETKDPKTGKSKEVCKEIKTHKKLEGTEVPTKK